MEQPIVLDTLAPPQNGAWVSGSTVSTSSPQSWKNGDTVYALVINISSLTVSSVANGGSGLGSWAVVTDGSTTAVKANSTTLEAELWAASCTADGSGVITATMSGTAAAGTEIMTFGLYGTQIAADAVAVANANAAVVALPAATTVFGDAQALTIFVTKSSNNVPTAQSAAYTLIGNVGSTVLGSVTLANAFTVAAGTTVTPTVTNATQTSGAPSVAITVMLRPPVPPPTALTATYTAGSGITLAFTAPSGFSGTGYNVYRSSTATGNANGVAKKIATLASNATGFVDRNIGYPAVNSGENVATYYVTTLDGTVFQNSSSYSESPGSVTATATFLG